MPSSQTAPHLDAAANSSDSAHGTIQTETLSSATIETLLSVGESTMANVQSIAVTTAWHNGSWTRPNFPESGSQ